MAATGSPAGVAVVSGSAAADERVGRRGCSIGKSETAPRSNNHDQASVFLLLLLLLLLVLLLLLLLLLLRIILFYIFIFYLQKHKIPS